MEAFITEFRMRFSKALRPNESPKLRGYFGRSFESEELLHHHKKDGSLLYAYPRIQFKVIKNAAYLIGFGDGGELLSKLWLKIDKAKVGLIDMPVIESSIIKRKIEIGESPNSVAYRFISPWLALNQRNESMYRQTKSASERASMLGNIMVGNCLSLAKAFNYNVRSRLTSDCSRLHEIRCSLKGVGMRGFVGRFKINFDLPDRIGLGKSVSRGFGTIERTDGNH
jgi:hypothetical protein